MAGNPSSLAARFPQAGRRWPSLPPIAIPRLGEWSVLVPGVLGTAVVGYLTARNPAATPAGVAAPVRMMIIAAYTAAALFARHSDPGSRMARLLTAAIPLSAIWLLNGAAAPLAFSLGLLCAGMVPAGVAYLMLAHPSGHLHSVLERRFLAVTGGLTAGLWLAGAEVSGRAPLRTPLISCGSRCPATVGSLDLAPTAPPVLVIALVIAWLTMSVGTAVLIQRRDRAAAAALHRSLAPVAATASAVAILGVAFVLLRFSADRLAGGVIDQLASGVGLLYVSGAILIPLAVLLGLSMERLFMARTLARLVRQFAVSPEQDPRLVIAQILADPSLQIAYRRADTGDYVDASGAPVVLPGDDDGRSISWIQRQGRSVAAVIHDPELSDRDGFIEAVGAAALSRLERAQLEAELRASSSELAQSRIRLLESADAERRRLERDLHDGVQQDLIALRIKLGLAVDAARTDPRESERALEAVSRHMDEVLQTLRDFARGIYPAVLQERGVADALRSAAAGSPAQVSVRAFDMRRYPEDVEVAVYFCCMEALQNIAKHAGAEVPVTIKLFERGRRVHFEVRDFGCGFEAAASGAGSGLTNMRDRIEAIGGGLAISSAPGRGTTVRGSVPVEAPGACLVGAAGRTITPFG